MKGPKMSECARIRCPNLIEDPNPVPIETRKRSRICKITDRIPGNMAECPEKRL